LFEPDPERENKDPSIWQLIWPYVRATLAGTIIVALLYISGVYQAMLLRPTPESVHQESIASNKQYATITVPVHVYRLRGENQFASSRDTNETRALVQKASRIWHQAGITLEIASTTVHRLSEADQRRFLRDPNKFIRSLDMNRPASINILLTGTLQGLNGVTLYPGRDIVVSDLTSHYDFRTLAHEIGHAAELEHINDPRRLMSQASYGVELTKKEIANARATLKRLLQ
jgi:hypothetical protein